MSYNRVAIPRFYVDNINWLASRGWSKATEITERNTSTGIKAGYTKYDAFDLKPYNILDLDVGGTSTHRLFEIDFGVTSGMPINSIVIMNHNFKTAGANVRLAYSSSPFSNDTAAQGTTATTTGVLNYVDFETPIAADGDTIFTFTEVSNARYWLLDIYPDDLPGDTFDADITIGSIMLGKYYDMPVCADLNVTPFYDYGGNVVTETEGGNKNGSASWITNNDTTGTYAPFTSLTYFRRQAGRKGFKLSWSYLSDSDIVPTDNGVSAGADFVSNVTNKLAGNLLPFVFTHDSTSTTAGDYMLARLENEMLETPVMAWQKVSLANITVLQEF